MLSTLVGLSQTFTMTGSATFYNSGTFTLVNDNGKFRTDGATVNNVDNIDGVIQFSGTDNQFTDLSDDATAPEALGQADGTRITGQVDYDAVTTGVNQNVQERFYTDLSVSNTTG
jgi:hypothetical protein